ncbi:hypothetical protein MVEN_02176700 [Mycena venus]|uniref:Uncharacterized protein n=1 Tax=Mycena venus TaxID=2733690 RepID=A0A8H6X8R3_9AGAR|nr:hypothetical protein MVEN_02176700 [Mycena venus]
MRCSSGSSKRATAIPSLPPSMEPSSLTPGSATVTTTIQSPYWLEAPSTTIYFKRLQAKLVNFPAFFPPLRISHQNFSNKAVHKHLYPSHIRTKSDDYSLIDDFGGFGGVYGVCICPFFNYFECFLETPWGRGRYAERWGARECCVTIWARGEDICHAGSGGLDRGAQGSQTTCALAEVARPRLGVRTTKDGCR